MTERKCEQYILRWSWRLNLQNKFIISVSAEDVEMNVLYLIDNESQLLYYCCQQWNSLQQRYCFTVCSVNRSVKYVSWGKNCRSPYPIFAKSVPLTWMNRLRLSATPSRILWRRFVCLNANHEVTGTGKIVNVWRLCAKYNTFPRMHVYFLKHINLLLLLHPARLLKRCAPPISSSSPPWAFLQCSSLYYWPSWSLRLVPPSSQYRVCYIASVFLSYKRDDSVNS